MAKKTDDTAADAKPDASKRETAPTPERPAVAVLPAETSLAITALVDMHLATKHRGGEARYLAAAEKLAAGLVNSILGPTEPAAPPASTPTDA